MREAVLSRLDPDGVKRGNEQIDLLALSLTDAVLAALGEWAGGEADAVETGWLIERRRLGHPVDWASFEEGGAVWTTDSLKACRFARREDAEQLAYGEECDAITQHQWGCAGGEGGGFRVSREALCNCFLVPDSPLTARFVERIAEVIRAHGGEVVEGGGGE